ncbi:MAG: class A beta-lactamase-related serine hydrolase [Kaiparowitsia implicata GSE-PSE-MK54-09C]|jgi:hypothetical protein|nr:class A beta-lactamase-related serine hydrolase [Kaiparowitsia implicata GSE-PSE-MK54-09C]
MIISFFVRLKRDFGKLICLIFFIVSPFLVSPGIAIAASECTVPDSGNWVIDSDCDLVQNEIAPQNVVVRDGATLAVLNGRSLNIDFSNFRLQVASDSRVLIENGGRIHTFQVGHLLINNTDGEVGYYLKRVSGPVLEAYHENFPFYPASTIKVLQHLHAMRAVEADPDNLNLDTTTLTVCSEESNCSNSANSNSTCPIGTITETLRQALRNMMIPSNNQSTNAIQEFFGNGTPSVGRAAMNQTANNVVGMTNTALEHKFACDGPNSNPPNKSPLADLGLLYEQVATNPDVIQAATRTIFYQLMRNESNDRFVDPIITQEASNLSLSSTNTQTFRNQVRMAHKAGNISSNYQSIGGWIELPINGGTDTREYVYGFFVDNTSTNTLPNNGNGVIDTVAGELLRDVIRSALETW